MAYPIDFVERIKTLRTQGYSIKELARQFRISSDTASRWVKDIELNSRALWRLKKRKLLGQYKARDTLRKRSVKLNELIKSRAIEVTKNLVLDRNLAKLSCSLLYWCEGNKNTQHVRFTSSDESLIRLFLTLLRKGFNLDESRFRALIHLHEYHNEAEQKKYWSSITKIPLTQFNNSYLKPNTGKRKRHDYAGCLAVSYYDHKVAKELQAIYNSFVSRGVGQW